MAKYIDAERYINNLRELRTGDKDTVYEYYDDGIDVAISEAATFPAADVEPRWIPVSERLPEKQGWYLVTRIDCGEYKFVDDSFLFLEDDGTPHWSYKHVVAWQPLPEPYEEGEQNG